MPFKEWVVIGTSSKWEVWDSGARLKCVVLLFLGHLNKQYLILQQFKSCKLW